MKAKPFFFFLLKITAKSAKIISFSETNNGITFGNQNKNFHAHMSPSDLLYLVKPRILLVDIRCSAQFIKNRTKKIIVLKL